MEIGQVTGLAKAKVIAPSFQPHSAHEEDKKMTAKIVRFSEEGRERMVRGADID